MPHFFSRLSIWVNSAAEALTIAVARKTPKICHPQVAVLRLLSTGSSAQMRSPQRASREGRDTGRHSSHHLQEAFQPQVLISSQHPIALPTQYQSAGMVLHSMAQCLLPLTCMPHSQPPAFCLTHLLPWLREVQGSRLCCRHHGRNGSSQSPTCRNQISSRMWIRRRILMPYRCLIQLLIQLLPSTCNCRCSMIVPLHTCQPIAFTASYPPVLQRRPPISKEVMALPHLCKRQG